MVNFVAVYITQMYTVLHTLIKRVNVTQDFKKHLPSTMGKPHGPREASAKPPIMRCWGLIALAATVWFTLYKVIQTFANWITYGLECFRQPTSLDESLLFRLSLRVSRKMG